MTAIAFAAPFLPGKAEAFRRFAQEALGARRKQQDESRSSKGLTRELCWIQSTPQGEMLIVLLEGEDPARANREFAASDSAYDRWFKQEVGSMTGIDFNQPLPVLPELVFDWQKG